MVTEDELDRLDRLIGRFGYGAARSVLVDAAQPCVSLFLESLPANVDEGGLRILECGASRVGGAPDLPLGMPWPIVTDGYGIDPAQRTPGYAGFLMQIALENMPQIADSPLPTPGISGRASGGIGRLPHLRKAV